MTDTENNQDTQFFYNFLTAIIFGCRKLGLYSISNYKDSSYNLVTMEILNSFSAEKNVVVIEELNEQEKTIFIENLISITIRKMEEKYPPNFIVKWFKNNYSIFKETKNVSNDFVRDFINRFLNIIGFRMYFRETEIKKKWEKRRERILKNNQPTELEFFAII